MRLTDKSLLFLQYFAIALIIQIVLFDISNGVETGGPVDSIPGSNSGSVDTTITPERKSSNLTAGFLPHKRERVCRGTSFGLTHTEKELDRYNLYKAIYTNCTYVDGNLELVFLQDHDLSFLRDIKEVTGYVLIVANEVDYIPLSSLMIIRGRSLFEYESKYYSLYVALNYHTNLTTNLGLKELRLSNLHEIMAGNVFFYENKLLCLENKINWTDIITGEGAQVFFDNSQPARNCGGCDSSCEVFNRNRHCWGSGPEYCQKLTKLSCSPQCDGRCFGPLPNQCCHPECAAGCNGPSKDQCWACKNFNNDGNCENYCPPETIYSQKHYKNIPNPNAKYAYGALCVDKCPPHLIADRGACVQDCGAGKIAGMAGKCVDCDGPCPKTCKIDLGADFINSKNIHRYTGCTIIQGSIKILYSTFTYDAFKNISALQVEDLSVLETIQEVTDFVQIQGNQPEFRTLSFLKNLKVIHGRQLASGSSLQIFQTSLLSLGLDSLENVRFGTIFISNNSGLCYANSIKWENIRERDNQKIFIEHNRNSSACVADNEICSAECTDEGCWGPYEHQCRSCRNFHLDKQCLSSCASASGVYQSGINECRRCHPQCRTNCTGEGSDKCDYCLNARDGPYCVPQCPTSKYRDENSVCQMCHSNCESGCTGPRNTIGERGCNSCSLLEFSDDGSTVSSCLPPESNCSDGYYKTMLPSNFPLRGLSGKQACMRCDPECRTCIGNGITFCSTCKHFSEGGRCVSSCSKGYYLDPNSMTCFRCDPRCLMCTGPSAFECLECKEYKLYLDYDSRKDNRSFTCTDHCPDRLPHTVQEPVEGTVNFEMVCSNEDKDIKKRNAYIGIGSAGGAVIVFIFIGATFFLLVKCRRSNDNKHRLRKTMINGETSEKIEPMFPTETKPDMSNLRLITESELHKGISIGSGAFGTVYKGEWIDLNRNNKRIDVAIKVLREGTSSAQTKELLEEARIMASVNHPCCAKILAVCLSHDVMLITKLMQRGCMLDYIRKTSGMGSESLLRWCKQIAEGMDYLESKQIVHRDLAARNVLVESREQVKITDFGLARLQQDEDQIRFSGGKMPIKWLALECLNQRVFTHKSDVWSYGIAIWELLTLGERPYDQMKTADIPHRLEQGMRLAKPKWCKGEEVYEIMLACWNKDPNARPSFKVLVEDFEILLDDPEQYLYMQRQDLRPSSVSYGDGSRHMSTLTRIHHNSRKEESKSNPRPNHQSLLSNPNQSLDRTPDAEDSLTDDVFDFDTRTLARSPVFHQTAADAYAQFNFETHPIPKRSSSRRGTNGDLNRTDMMVRGNGDADVRTDVLVANQNCDKKLGVVNQNAASAEVGTRTPVWTRRQESIDAAQRIGEGRGRTIEDAADDGYLQPIEVDPIRHVDLLNGHYRPAQVLQNGAKTSTSSSNSTRQQHPNSSQIPLLPRRSQELRHNHENHLISDPPSIPLRLRKGSHECTDTDLSSSTLDASEPDYYNDFCEPLAAEPLLTESLESPV